MYQKLIVEGRLGSDAEVKTSKNGAKYLCFSLASNTGNKDNEKTTWFDVVSFEERHAGKFADYLKKGSAVIVDGKPEFSIYIDKTNTAKGNYKIIVRDIEFVSSGIKKSEDEQQQSSRPAVSKATELPSDMDMGPATDSDDLPF